MVKKIFVSCVIVAFLYSCSDNMPVEESRRLCFSDLDLSLITKIDTNKINCLTELYSGSADSSRKFAWQEYDSLGRMIKSFLLPPYHNNSEYTYNDSNLVKIVVYNEIDTFRANYRFDHVNNILFQLWSGSRSDTNIFFFDSEGKLNKSLGAQKVEQSGMLSWDQLKFFEFDESNRVKEVRTIQLDSKADTANLDSLYSSIRVDEYRYGTNTHLDSILSTVKFKTGEQFKRVSRYDNFGRLIISQNDDGFFFKEVTIEK